MNRENCRLKIQLGHFRGSKRRLIGGSLITCLVVGLGASGVAGAQVNVTTGHNDIGRTGQNLNETILTTSNVNSTQFGKLFSQPVDGQISAQPLYLSGITVNGAVHNVVFVATENDSVYAFDADNNGAANSTPLWQAPLLSPAYGAAPNATPLTSTEVGTNDIAPILGITGTPVIDPSTGTLYVVSISLENGAALHRLHALSVYTGAEKFGGPVVITATVPGTGNGSVNGSLTFDSLWQNQRAGLLLLNGIVYVAFASNADNGPWHGWIMGYNAATLQQTGVFCGSPNGLGTGFWMSGDGLPADQLDPVNHPFGRIIVPTGNGDADPSIPYNSSMDFGESILDLDLTNGVPTVTDEFTTYQWQALNAEDLDVGSGGSPSCPPRPRGAIRIWPSRRERQAMFTCSTGTILAAIAPPLTTWFKNCPPRSAELRPAEPAPGALRHTGTRQSITGAETIILEPSPWSMDCSPPRHNPRRRLATLALPLHLRKRPHDRRHRLDRQN